MTNESKPERAPAGTGPAGRRLWTAVLGEYELDQHERAILVEACRTLDLLDSLETILQEEGVVIDSPQGRKAHPAATEARQQRVTLARLLAALRLPAGEEGGDRRPQRRGAPRGVYGIRGAM